MKEDVDGFNNKTFNEETELRKKKGQGFESIQNRSWIKEGDMQA